MIDSDVWAQYINVTDTHTDSHVAIAERTAPAGKKQAADRQSRSAVESRSA